MPNGPDAVVQKAFCVRVISCRVWFGADTEIFEKSCVVGNPDGSGPKGGQAAGFVMGSTDISL